MPNHGYYNSNKQYRAAAYPIAKGAQYGGKQKVHKRVHPENKAIDPPIGMQHIFGIRP